MRVDSGIFFDKSLITVWVDSDFTYGFTESVLAFVNNSRVNQITRTYLALEGFIQLADKNFLFEFHQKSKIATRV